MARHMTGAADRSSDPFDPGFLRHVIDDAFGPVIDHWFRPRLIGAARLPETGPAILAANHSGTAFPYDGMVLDALLWRRSGMRTEAKLRSVYEKQLSLTWWMRPFGLDDFWRRCGGVDMTFDNFDRLLARGERVGYYPEGVPGIGKGFQNRYRLQPFHTSFVRLAARHGAPIVPISIVNAEWVIPFNFTLRPLDRLMQRLFNVPFLPLPGGVIAITLPWAWYLALPARMVFVVGDPIDVRAMLGAEGVRDFAAVDDAALGRVTEQVRVRMQRDLDRGVARYGRHPYQLRLLRRELGRAWRRGLLARVLPTGWAVTFSRLDRDARRPAARGRLHRWLRDWDLLGYWLPFGWPLLSLARAFRRPPCGYRGLSRAERARAEGAYVWRLSERPLPPRRVLAAGGGSERSGR
jgi:1-acyl-sn-glycerol-3-phosphate acyltransferase